MKYDQCPKCGYDGRIKNTAMLEAVDAVLKYRTPIYDRSPWKIVWEGSGPSWCAQCRRLFEEKNDEYLLITCPQCGFFWREPPRDAKEDE